MKIIGLTGGIGSGKSTVAQVFEVLGVPVFSADAAGRTVLDTDAAARKEVIALLGSAAYNGPEANRKFIAEKVFGDEQLLASLNAIIHPAVRRAFDVWYERSSKTHSYCIREAAILFESGAHADCDKVICVVADAEVRIHRVINRDQSRRAEVEARMAQQMPQDEKAAKSDFVIENNGSRSVIQQVLEVHALLQA